MRLSGRGQTDTLCAGVRGLHTVGFQPEREIYRGLCGRCPGDSAPSKESGGGGGAEAAQRLALLRRLGVQAEA